MPLILPGVEIKVVKDIVVKQLNPAGILGLIGISEDIEDGTPRPVGRASSYKELRMRFGRALEYTVPEAKLAFQNGISEIVFSPLKGVSAKRAQIELKNSQNKPGILLEARAKGLWGNHIKVKVEQKPDENGKMTTCKMSITYKEAFEFYDNLEPNPKSERYILKVLNEQSDIVTASVIGLTKKQKKKETEDKETLTIESEDIGLPDNIEAYLTDGKGMTLKDYQDAIEKLESEEDVDLIVASIEDYNDISFVKNIYQMLEAHCRVMSDQSMNRIAFGSVPPSTLFSNPVSEIEQIKRLATTLASERFVLTAPYGTLGAIIGTIGSLPPHQSPTYKKISGVPELERRFNPSELKELVNANVLVIEEKKERGFIIEKGITTNGEQISVQRVADRAVRGVKQISERFIGTLNTVIGRTALKEKCTEFFIQMEKENAIVPSADGKEPAFKVDVYATDDDISKGIVRLDIAVRPVRAIDYIYGTILVKA